jgi:molybdopterin adenylyltransferase
MKAAILTISDSCAAGKRKDESGPAVEKALIENGVEVCERKIVADEHDKIVGALKHFSDSAGVDVIFTTGGTGVGPRDVTPEATEAACQRMVPGIGEMIRARGLEKTRNAALSRGVAGIRGSTLIVNLPGSPKGARESLETVIDVLPHAIEMLRGGGH